MVVTDLDDTGGRDVADKISAAGGEAIFPHQDVTLEEKLAGNNRSHRTALRASDVMVANAGIGILCKAVEMSLADWAATNRGEP